jgi:hypothetical protein
MLLFMNKYILVHVKIVNFSSDILLCFPMGVGVHIMICKSLYFLKCPEKYVY